MRWRCTGPKTQIASLFFCLFALFAVEEVGWCQPTSLPTQQGEQTDCLNDSKCSELYENARRLSQAGQYEAALVAYQSAYAQQPSPWLLVSIGRMQQKAGRPQQASQSFKRFLNDPAAKADEESLNKAREYLHQVEEQIKAQPPPSEVAPRRTEVAPPADSSGKTPAYKKWWFWTAIGGATAVVAVGLGVGLATRSPAAPSVPQGVSVYDTGF